MMSDDSGRLREAAGVSPSKPVKPRCGQRLFRKHWGWLLSASCVVAAMGLQFMRGYLDHAVINVGTLVLLVVAFVSAWWRVVRANQWLRRAILAVLIPAAILLAATVQIRGVSGELIPILRFRWMPSHDQQLGKIDTDSGGQSGATGVDLKTTRPTDFPGFLGPQRNAYLSAPRLARDWSAQPPRELWRRPIGAGWSGFAAVNGFAVTMEQRGAEELVTCYEVLTGKPRWSHSIQARHQTVLGGIGPRSTPTIAGGRVFALGATGVLRCLDGATGNELWSYDVLQTLGLTPDEDLSGVAWGRSSSPLVVGDLVVIPTGRSSTKSVSLTALHVETGDVVWEGGTQQVSYASPTLATLAGVRQILSVNESSVSGHDPDTGQTLWEHPWPGQSSSTASASQPHVLDGQRLLLSKAYGTGAAGLLLEKTDQGLLRARELWSDSGLFKTKFTNVCVINGFAYGLSDGILECADAATGKRRWKRGRYGHGQVLGAADVILVQAESGDVAMVAASPDQYQELAKFPALDGRTWNTLCLSGAHLLVRNAEEAACFELPLSGDDGPSAARPD